MRNRLSHSVFFKDLDFPPRSSGKWVFYIILVHRHPLFTVIHFSEIYGPIFLERRSEKPELSNQDPGPPKRPHRHVHLRPKPVTSCHVHLRKKNILPFTEILIQCGRNLLPLGRCRWLIHEFGHHLRTTSTSKLQCLHHPAPPGNVSPSVVKRAERGRSAVLAMDDPARPVCEEVSAPKTASISANPDYQQNNHPPPTKPFRTNY